MRWKTRYTDNYCPKSSNINILKISSKIVSHLEDLIDLEKEAKWTIILVENIFSFDSGKIATGCL